MVAPRRQPNLKLSVSDFGPIARAEIDLRPLTVFIGPSNTGKSYLAILIYSLHRSFSDRLHGYMPRSGFSATWPSIDKYTSLPDENDIECNRRRLAPVIEWMASARPTAKSRGSMRILSDEIANQVRPLLREGWTWNEMVLQYCFGTSNLARLTRRGIRKSATVALTRPAADFPQGLEPFSYGLSIGKKRIKHCISIPDSTPIPIGGVDDPQLIKAIEHFWSTVNPLLGDMDADYFYEYDLTLRFIAHIVGASLLSPFSNPAYYLPADRTGVMHSHQVVVASIVSGASTAGLIPGVRLPTLSGVLSDFLTQLIRLDTDVNANLNPGAKLADSIETAMLKGFDTQAIGRRRTTLSSITARTVGMMTCRSWDRLPMVSEIAPVVLVSPVCGEARRRSDN